MFPLTGCESKPSEREAIKQIQSAEESEFAVFSNLGMHCDVKILGISTEGKVATVRAEVSFQSEGKPPIPLKAQNFKFRKFDTGWTLENDN
jgi:hypothetical protein